ncbi:MAG: transposase [Cyanobacteria bacterium P01_C01_bin.72]
MLHQALCQSEPSFYFHTRTSRIWCEYLLRLVWSLNFFFYYSPVDQGLPNDNSLYCILGYYQFCREKYLSEDSRKKRTACAEVSSASRRSKQGIEQGIDGNKRVKGRKRHIVVDTLGMVLNCFVSAANLVDVKGAKAALAQVLEEMVRVETILANQAYKGALAETWEKAHNCILEVTEKLGEGLVVAPWRWAVERTFSWLEKSRRLCRDYEVLAENYEGVVYIVMIRLMLRRLTDNRRQRKSQLNTA